MPVWKSTSELNYLRNIAWTFVNIHAMMSSRRSHGDIVASMAWILHAIEQMQLRRQHRADGVGRPELNSHTDRDEPLEKKAPAMCPKAPVILTSFRTGRIAFVRSLLHKASKSIPSGALGGACRCVRRSNFSIHT